MTSTDRPKPNGQRPFLPPADGETHYQYLRRLDHNQRALIGRTVQTAINCGWSRFVVVGIARDGWRFQVRRLRAGNGEMNKTVSLKDPARTDFSRFFVPFGGAA